MKIYSQIGRKFNNELYTVFMINEWILVFCKFKFDEIYFQTI